MSVFLLCSSTAGLFEDTGSVAVHGGCVHAVQHNRSMCGVVGLLTNSVSMILHGGCVVALCTA